eukprot:3679549-Prymnesium_polylepis.1
MRRRRRVDARAAEATGAKVGYVSAARDQYAPQSPPWPTPGASPRTARPRASWLRQSPCCSRRALWRRP